MQTTNRCYPYKFVAARDFYEHVLARLAESPNVTYSMGRAPALWRRVAPALVRFARGAVPLIVAALVLLLGLYLLVPEAGHAARAPRALPGPRLGAHPAARSRGLVYGRQGLWRDSCQLSAISRQQKSSS